MITISPSSPSLTAPTIWVLGSVIRAFLKNIEVSKSFDLNVNIEHTGHNLVLTHALERCVTLTVRNEEEPWRGAISANTLLKLINTDSARSVAISRDGIRHFQAGQWWDIPKQEFDPGVEERNRTFNTLDKAIWTEAFVEKMREAQRFQSDDDTRAILNGVAVQGEHLIATDGRVMLVSPRNNSMLSTPIIVGNIPKLLGNTLVRIGNSDPEDKIPTHIQWQFWVEKAAIAITDKLVYGNYPNWKQVMPEPPEDPVTVLLPDKFGDILKLAKGEKHMRLFNEGETVMGQLPLQPPFPITGCHWFGEEGQKWQVAFDPKFAVKAVKAGFRGIEIKDESSAMRWKRLPDDGDLVVLMPMRVS